MNESLNFFLETKRRRTGEAKDHMERVQQKGWGEKTKNKLKRAKKAKLLFDEE